MQLLTGPLPELHEVLRQGDVSQLEVSFLYSAYLINYIEAWAPDRDNLPEKIGRTTDKKKSSSG